MRGTRRAPRVIALAVAAVVAVSMGVAWAAPTPEAELDPVGRFSLTIDGFEIAALARCSMSSDLPEEGGADVQILCERQLTDDLDLAAWHEQAALGDLTVAKKSFTLTAYAADGAPNAQWHATDGYPVALTTHFDEAGVGREIVTFTAEFLQRITV